MQVGRYIWCAGFYNGYSKVINEAGYVGLIDIKGEVYGFFRRAKNYRGHN